MWRIEGLKSRVRVSSRGSRSQVERRRYKSRGGIKELLIDFISSYWNQGRKFRWKFGGVGLMPDEKGVVKNTTPTLNMDFIYFKNFVSVFCFFANSLVTNSISDNIDSRLLACET